jgi:hypothetical protein
VSWGFVLRSEVQPPIHSAAAGDSDSGRRPHRHSSSGRHRHTLGSSQQQCGRSTHSRYGQCSITHSRADTNAATVVGDSSRAGLEISCAAAAPTVGVFEREMSRGAATRVFVSCAKYPEVCVANPRRGALRGALRAQAFSLSARGQGWMSPPNPQPHQCAAPGSALKVNTHPTPASLPRCRPSPLA